MTKELTTPEVIEGQVTDGPQFDTSNRVEVTTLEMQQCVTNFERACLLKGKGIPIKNGNFDPDYEFHLSNCKITNNLLIEWEEKAEEVE